MRIRESDWHYASHGPYLVTRHWSDGRSETNPADTLEAALHRALQWHNLGADHSVVVIDGWGEFVFARSARTAPPDQAFNIGTSECYQLLIAGMPHDGPFDDASSRLFAGIDSD